MNYTVGVRSVGFGLGVVAVIGLAGCSGKVRTIDLESKQFEVTVNVDSTAGLDSARLEEMKNNKVIYSFREGGEGRQHTQVGMISRETPFSWQIKNDSILLDERKYAIQKTVEGFRLKSDSTLILLRPQP